MLRYRQYVATSALTSSFCSANTRKVMTETTLRPQVSVRGDYFWKVTVLKPEQLKNRQAELGVVPQIPLIRHARTGG